MKLVIDNNVQGKVNIFIAQKVPRKEAITIIEMNLALNGFSLVPTEGDVVEVVGVNKNPRAAAVPIVSDPADIPEGAKVVSYLFRLSYADPQELQSVLSQYLAGIGGQAPILALAESVQPARDPKRRRSAQAGANGAATRCRTGRGGRASSSNSSGPTRESGRHVEGDFRKGRRERPQPARRHPRRPQACRFRHRSRSRKEDEGDAVLSEDSLIVGKIKLEADVRTNRIHVVTRPINMPFIEQVDRGVRRQCGIRQTGDAAAAIHRRGGRSAGAGAGADRAG